MTKNIKNVRRRMGCSISTDNHLENAYAADASFDARDDTPTTDCVRH